MGVPYADPTNTGQWAQDLLYDLGDPSSPVNVGYLEAWQQTESPSGFGYNPLGTEQTAPGSVKAPGNTASVQAYQSWKQGLAATVATLEDNPANAKLLALLKSGNASVAQLSAAEGAPGASWASGPEPRITAIGTSVPFSYGGTQGLVKGALGVSGTPETYQQFMAQVKASAGAQQLGLFNPVTSLSQAATNPQTPAGSAVSGVLGPLVGWITKGAADVTFVGFGLLLVVVGLIVTFRGGGDGSSSSGGIVETGSKVAEVAAA